MTTPSTNLCARAPDRLVAAFEGLGTLCEFGIVQSFCGVEPLGLFRFAALPHDKLIDLLATRLEALDDPDEVCIFTRPGDQEWIGHIPRYGIEFSTRAEAVFGAVYHPTSEIGLDDHEEENEHHSQEGGPAKGEPPTGIIEVLRRQRFS